MYHLTGTALRFPRLTVALAVVLSALGGWAASRTPFTAGAYAWIGPDHPVVREFEGFIERYGGGYPIIIAWSCLESRDPCKSAFDEDSLRMADEIGTELERSPNVARVSSPANLPLLVPIEQGIHTHVFVQDGRVDAPPELVAQVLEDPTWVGSVISKDGRVGALVVEMPTTDTAAQIALMEEIDALLDAFRRDGFQFFLSGSPTIQVALLRGSAEDGARVGAMTGITIAAVLFALIGSWQSVVAALLGIGMATACGWALLPLLGWSRDPITAGTPSLILVMGSADAVHLLTCYWRLRRDGLAREAALQRAARETHVPCTMTTLTTAAGLLSFLAGDGPAVRHFGAVAAAGVASCLLFTFSFLPAMIVLLPDSPALPIRVSEIGLLVVQRLSSFSLAYPRRLLGAIGAVTLLCAAGLPRLSADVDLVEYWKPGDEVRTNLEFVSDHIRYMEGFEIELSMPDPLTDPGALAEVRTMEVALSRTRGLVDATSVATLTDRIARAIGDTGPGMRGVSDYLTLISLGSPSALDAWVSIDLRRIRVSAEATSSSLSGRKRALSDIERILAGMPAGWSHIVTGPSKLEIEMSSLIERNANQIVLASTVMVALLVVLFLRSIRWGALAMIPNIVPLVILFGLMGIWGIPLDGGSVMVAPIAIGISVDDTIHLLHIYTRERRSGADSVTAIRVATQTVGRAVVTTSCALALGFSTMTASRFQSVSNIGLLSAAAILAALAAELLVLPALLSVASQWRGRFAA